MEKIENIVMFLIMMANDYDQNTVLSSNIVDIVIQNNFILVRKQEENFDDDILEMYDWPN